MSPIWLLFMFHLHADALSSLFFHVLRGTYADAPILELVTLLLYYYNDDDDYIAEDFEDYTHMIE